MADFIITEGQVQQVLDSMDRSVKADGPRIRAAIETIGEHVAPEVAMAVTSFAVLKKMIYSANIVPREEFMNSGCKKSLGKMWDLFPTGRDGRTTIKELMTHKEAWKKENSVMWHIYFGNHTSSYKRAKALVRYEEALLDAYSQTDES